MNLIIITIIMPNNVQAMHFLYVQSIIFSSQLSSSIRHMPFHIDQYALHHISFYYNKRTIKVIKKNFWCTTRSRMQSFRIIRIFWYVKNTIRVSTVYKKKYKRKKHPQCHSFEVGTQGRIRPEIFVAHLQDVSYQDKTVLQRMAATYVGQVLRLSQ